MEGQWKFRGGRGSQKPIFLKESMRLNWNFQRGGGIQTKKRSVGGVWIFSGNNTLLIIIIVLWQINK